MQDEEPVEFEDTNEKRPDPKEVQKMIDEMKDRLKQHEKSIVQK